MKCGSEKLVRCLYSYEKPLAKLSLDNTAVDLHTYISEQI